MLKVKQLINSNGNAVRNQFVIIAGGKTYLQSYESIVCCIDKESDTITFYPCYDFSPTTMKYVKQFLEMFSLTAQIAGVKNTRKAIAEGGYILAHNAKRYIAVKYDDITPADYR